MAQESINNTLSAPSREILAEVDDRRRYAPVTRTISSNISSLEADSDTNLPLETDKRLINGDSSFSFLGEGVQLNSWNLIANISSKVISVGSEFVTIECSIDKEKKLYQERNVDISLFDELDINQGDVFKLCIYRRTNQQMIEIKFNPALVAADDFPEFDFFDQFSNMELVKKVG